MRVPISWLREYAPVPAAESGRDIADRLIAAGLEVETVDTIGEGSSGPLVVGQVAQITELTEFKKPIRLCQVAVGSEHGHPDTPGLRQIICGAQNFQVSDLVPVALPGAVLPGDFVISARETYGHTSDGMICSDRELGVGEDGDGILVLPPGSAAVGADAAPLLGIGEDVLDIAVTPDRGYALSVRGVAREAATAYGVPFRDPGQELLELPIPEQQAVPAECGSADPAACDLFTARTIAGFSPQAATPLWMRTRLVAAGMRSISLAVDVTNYVMLELGQPLHAFDRATLTGPVRARRAQSGETLETLDHVVRKLDPADLVIADDSGPIGLAGTMGGFKTEISPDTQDIVLEAAHFDPVVIARMARRHKLSSEASRRFERGVDRLLAPVASERAAALLLEYGGGDYLGMTAVESQPAMTEIRIDTTLPARVAGMTIAAETTVAKLTEVGCAVSHEGDELLVSPPSWRPDLTDPNDLVEEVLRLVGYDKIPATLPSVAPGTGWSVERKLSRRVGVALAGAGFVEAPAYPFIGDKDLDVLGLPSDDARRATVRLANPLSDEQPLLRTTLLPGLISTALRNLSRGAEDLALFELGLIFQAKSQPKDRMAAPTRPTVTQKPTEAELDALAAILPDQPRHVAVLLTGAEVAGGWWGEPRPASWATAIAAGRLVAQTLGLELGVTPTDAAPFHPGRAAHLLLDAGPIGVAGELHPRVIEATGLPHRSCAMELDLDALIAAVGGLVPAPELGTMPVAKEDIALVVRQEVSAAELGDVLLAGGGDLLESVRLFDEFVDEKIGAGKRSLAFALRYRAPDRTLQAAEVAEVRQAAISAAAEAFGAVLRG